MPTIATGIDASCMNASCSSNTFLSSSRSDNERAPDDDGVRLDAPDSVLKVHQGVLALFRHGEASLPGGLDADEHASYVCPMQEGQTSSSRAMSMVNWQLK